MIVRRLSLVLATVAGALAPVVVNAPSPAVAATCQARAYVANGDDNNVSTASTIST